MCRATTIPMTLLLILALALPPWPCALASDGKPLIVPIIKDESTSLYTIPLKDGHRPLVLDLAGPLVWSTCESTHPTFDLYQRECMEARRHTSPKCWMYSGHAMPESFGSNKCVAHPNNPVSGRCAAGELTSTQLSANATDGKAPLYSVSFSAIASCAPDSLLAMLPAGAAGVAGLSRSELALPAQVALTQKVAKKFLLCLSGSEGVAIFGGGAIASAWRPCVGLGNLAPEPTIPLQRNFGISEGHFIKAKGISVNGEPMLLNVSEFVIELSTTTPYTALRPDLYGSFVQAYDRATAAYPRIMPPVPPFDICYDKRKMYSTRVGYPMPEFKLALEGGSNWTMFSTNLLVELDAQTACLAFVEMKQKTAGGPAPGMVMGGHQMEGNPLVFDLERGMLGWGGQLMWLRTSCENFNSIGSNGRIFGFGNKKSNCMPKMRRPGADRSKCGRVHPYVTVHFEYPGCDDGSLSSLLPPGVREEDLSPAQRYALAKIDVDAHPVLQLGITVSGSGGRLPVLPGPWGPAETVWQVGFHDDDAGQGVSLRAFAAALFGFGVVAAVNLGRVTWVAFGGLYHFGFLLKILSFGRPLPDTKEEFLVMLAAYLGRTVFDARYIATKLPICSDTSSDLTAMAELLDAPAVEGAGGLWQAGEKSLAACQVFVRTKGLFFAWHGVGMHAGRIHGLH
ncbi:hypothetical protein EJB05_23048, partial [Eragrostis curvula]